MVCGLHHPVRPHIVSVAFLYIAAVHRPSMHASFSQLEIKQTKPTVYIIEVQAKREHGSTTLERRRLWLSAASGVQLICKLMLSSILLQSNFFVRMADNANEHCQLIEKKLVSNFNSIPQADQCETKEAKDGRAFWKPCRILPPRIQVLCSSSFSSPRSFGLAS